ncbi:MAG: FxsA family protein [Streptosporangiaceae bacterium]
MAALLVLGFLALPILEIYVIIQVGGVIGAVPTVLLLLVESLLGAWIIRREGRRAWHKVQETLAQGRMPDRELSDAALILAGGVLLLIPGFVTDAAGFLFVLPFTRPLVRRGLTAVVSHRMRVRSAGTPPRHPGEVIQGEVIDDREA